MLTRAERLTMEMRCCDPDGNRVALTVNEARELFADLLSKDVAIERLRDVAVEMMEKNTRLYERLYIAECRWLELKDENDRLRAGLGRIHALADTGTGPYDENWAASIAGVAKETLEVA